MHSITNKIAIMLIIALFISFSAMSAVSYYTAQNKVVELVNQTQDKVLQDIKSILSTFLSEKIELAQKVGQALSDRERDISLIEQTVVNSKAWGGKVVDLVYAGYESDGAMYRSNLKHQMPSDGYDPRDRDWYKQVKSTNKPVFTEPYIQLVVKTVVWLLRLLLLF